MLCGRDVPPSQAAPSAAGPAHSRPRRAPAQRATRRRRHLRRRRLPDLPRRRVPRRHRHHPRTLARGWCYRHSRSRLSSVASRPEPTTCPDRNPHPQAGPRDERPRGPRPKGAAAERVSREDQSHKAGGPGRCPRRHRPPSAAPQRARARRRRRRTPPGGLLRRRGQQRALPPFGPPGARTGPVRRRDRGDAERGPDCLDGLLQRALARPGSGDDACPAGACESPDRCSPRAEGPAVDRLPSNG